MSGGGIRDVLENVVHADWSPDGSSYAVARDEGGKFSLEYPAGKLLLETASRPVGSPRVSPKGDRVAAFEFDGAIGDYSVVIVGPGHPREILSRGWRGTGGLVWSPDGSEIWFAGTRGGGDPGVYAVTMSGKERLLLQSPGWIVLFDVSSDGQLLASPTVSRIGISYWRQGHDAREMGWLDASLVNDMSSDGSKILFIEADHLEGRNSAIYLRGLDDSPAIRLGFGNRPALSPDGKWVVSVRQEPSGSRTPARGDRPRPQGVRVELGSSVDLGSISDAARENSRGTA